MVNIGEDQQTHLYVLQSHRQFNGGFRPSDKGAHPDPDISSLRSKRFQSSYSAKFGAGAKKNGRGEGEGRSSFTPLPLPLHSFFCSRSSFLYELARNRLLRRLAKDTLGLAPPTHRSHLNLPPAGAEKIWLPIYGSASWGQAAELLKASERKFLRCAGKVLRAEKEKLFLPFQRSSSKWIVFCNGFCNWVQRSWMFRSWKSHKIRVFKRVEWGPGNKT